MESGNRDLMNMLLHGGSTENGSQQSLESFGQQYTSPVSMSGHTTSMQPPLTSPMGQQQGSPFHGQMISQNPMMQQGDMMSTPYSQSPTSYSDSTYQGYPGYNQQRMSHPQVSSTMYQNYGQNGSFLSSLGNQGVGQYSAQSRAMSQYPASTSSVGFGPPSYYSDVYPPVPPKSPAAHQQLQGSGYPSSIQGTMSVGGNGSSYPSTGYAGQSSMSPLQKPMGQSFFPPRSPASQQINSPPNMTGNYPGQPPTSPMAQPMVGHPRRSSTSPVSSMVPQGVPVYSVPQRQQYPTTTSSMSQSQLQSSCMFAQRLEKMSAQHQYQAQMSSSNLPGPTGSGLSPSRRATFPAQQSHLPGMHTMKTATGPVSPVQRSPPQIGKSSPPFKPLRSPPPYQAHKSPPSFPKTLVPIPYPPQGGNDTRKQEKGAIVSGSVPEGGQPPAKKARKSKSAEKSIFQKLEEVAENVTPYLAEGLSHAVGDTVEQKQSQTKTKASTTEDDNEVNPKTTTEAEVSKADKLSSEGNVEEKDSLKDSQAKDSVPETGDKEEDGANETVSGKDTKVDEDKGQDKVVKHNEDVIIKEESTPKAQCEKEKSKETDKKEDSTNDDTKQHSAKSKDKVVSPINKEAQVCARSDTCKLPTTEKESPDTHSKVPNQAGPNESTTEKETSDKSKAIKETSRINFVSAAVNKPTTKHDAHQKVGDPFIQSKTLFSKSKLPGNKVSISRSGHPATIQATVIAKGQSAQSNQQVLVAKTAGGQMYLIQGNVLIPVQNITVQQPNGEKGKKVICVNQGQGKSSHVMVGNITPNLIQKTDKLKSHAPKYDVDDDSDDELRNEMGIDLACREKSLLSPTAEMGENEAGSSSFDSSRSTISSQTERHILKSRFSRSEERPRFGFDSGKSTVSAASKASNLEKSLNAIKAKLELEQQNQMAQSAIEMKKRIGRPMGSKDKYKRKSYLYKRPVPEEQSMSKKTGFSSGTSSVSPNERRNQMSVKEQSQTHKRPHAINVPTVSKASRTMSKQPKIIPPPHSPTITLLVQPRGGVDGDKWVCSFCGKPSNQSSLGVLYGPYKAKLSRGRTDSSRECRSPEKVLSPGGRLPELPTELEGSTIELWMHKDCGTWSQGVYMLGRSLYGLEQAVESAASHKCSTCMELGATMQCFKRGCTSIFHFACARDSGCAFVEENFTIFCSVHK